ncbi:MAG: hypothetical protein AABN95_08675 [Acidobacteriota bacterium]
MKYAKVLVNAYCLSDATNSIEESLEKEKLPIAKLADLIVKERTSRLF